MVEGGSGYGEAQSRPMPNRNLEVFNLQSLLPHEAKYPIY